MKISSEHINNLLAYARERHGAPCRVELMETAWPEMWENDEPPLDCAIYFREQNWWTEPIERILI